MDFLEALSEAVDVIYNNQDGTLDEVYLYEPTSQTQIYLKDCEGGLIIEKDSPAALKQIFLGAFLDKCGRSKALSLDDIFNEWEVQVKKSSRQTISKRKEASNV